MKLRLNKEQVMAVRKGEFVFAFGHPNSERHTPSWLAKWKAMDEPGRMRCHATHLERKLRSRENPDLLDVRERRVRGWKKIGMSEDKFREILLDTKTKRKR